MHMKKLEELDLKNKPHLWMKRENHACWARSHFSTRAKCDILVNNMSESFNSYIMEARDKPIITMLEYIRRKFMNRIQIKKQGMEKYPGPICPSIQKKLEINKVDSGNCFPIFAGELKFEVDCHDSTHIVDLAEHTCSCRLWDLSGIPCKHAISCIYLNKQRPEDYVSRYYSKEVYLLAYNSMIHPVPGEHDWVQTGMDAIAPPFYRKQTGRPKKLRRKGADEPINPYKVSRRNKGVTCAKCLQLGHNQRSCKGPVHPKSKGFKGKASHSQV